MLGMSGILDSDIVIKNKLSKKVKIVVSHYLCKKTVSRFHSLLFAVCKMPYLTERHKIEILMMIGYGDRTRTQNEVTHLFREKYPNLPPISRSTVSKIEKQFRENGHFRQTNNHRRSALSEEVKINVLLSVEENPHVSTRQIARELEISQSSVERVLKVEKFHPYKITILQELTEDDPDRRLQFCEQMMDLLDRNVLQIENVLFSDESTFMLNGEVNRQNCRYWADRNPHWMREGHTQRPEKVNVWAGIVGDRVIGPIFFQENLNGARYLEFLQEEVVPNLAILFPDPIEADVPNRNIWFQQDGAPPHFARPVREYLDDVFPDRWIGRRGPYEWAPRSPDLTPLDFFLWGYLKSKVFKTKPANIDDLKERIRQECRLISGEVIRNVQNEFRLRLGYCQLVNGQHFEHLLKKDY